MSGRDILWSQPLKVTLHAGMDRTFGSVYEALDFLENEWPQKSGASATIGLFLPAGEG